MNVCIGCGQKDSYENLVQINVRDKGKLKATKFVHAACYQKDPEGVKRKVRGKNPKFFFMGGQS